MRIASTASTLALLAPLVWSFGCADDSKRPLGASCSEPAQCQSGLCVDSTCVDPNAQPPAEGPTFHFGTFKWAVEASPGVGRIYFGADELARAQLDPDGDATGGTLSVTSACRADASLEPPPGDDLRTYAWCEDGGGGGVGYATSATGFTVDLPADGPDTNPLGFTESSEASTFSFLGLGAADPLADDAGAFIGYNTRAYAVEGEGSETQGREIELGVFVPTSEDASPDDFAGPYGSVRFLVTAVAEGIESDPELEVDVEFNAFDVAAGSDGLDLTFTSSDALALRHAVGSDVVTSRTVEGDVPFTIPVALAADGSLALAADGKTLRGAISPSGDFLFFGGGVPDALSGADAEGTVIDPDAPRAEAEALFAVRRDEAPDLAGREYALMRHEVFLRAGHFEVGRFEPGATLVFDELGGSATMTSVLTYASASFDGTLEATGDGDDSVTFQVSVDAEGGATGRIRLDAEVPGGEFTASGFAAEGGRVLLLGDRYQDTNVDVIEGGVGFALAVCTNCDGE